MPPFPAPEHSASTNNEDRRLNDRAVSPLEPGALLGPYRIVAPSLVLLKGVSGLGPSK